MKVLKFIAASAVLSLATLSSAAYADGGSAEKNQVKGRSASNVSFEYVPAFSADLPTSAATGKIPTGQGPHLASVAPSAVSWICTVYASDPQIAYHSSRQSVEGEGWQSCTGTEYWLTALKVTVQKYKGLGIWNNLYQYDSGYTSQPWLEQVVWWYCSVGSGWQTYRIVTDGYQGTYHQAVQSLNYLRAYCPS